MEKMSELQIRFHLTDNENRLVNFLMEKPMVSEEIHDELGISHLLTEYLSHIKRKGIVVDKWPTGKKNKMYYFIHNPLDIREQFNPNLVKTKDTNGELFNGVNGTSKVIQSYDMNIPHYRIPLPSDRVCGVVFGGDFHLGHTHCNYDLVKYFFETLRDTPNLYTVLLGDVIDNSVNAYSPKGTTNIVDKFGQMKLAEHLLFEIGGADKILYMIEGNHEMRSYLSDHFRVCDWLASEHSNRYGGYGKPFTINHGERDYLVFCRHKAKGSSQYNPLHSCIRAILFEYSEYARDADIVVTAHKHESAVAMYDVGGKERVMVAIGNSINRDDFAERVGFLSGVDDYPVVVFYPDGHVQVFRHFNDGVSEIRRYQ